MPTRKPRRRSWKNAPKVFVLLSCCPACGCRERELVRCNPKDENGEWSQQVKCDGCELIYIIKFEFPCDGKLQETWGMINA